MAACPVSAESGGFDYDFLEEVSAELKCSICLQVLREPNLTSCCGHRYCRQCIDRVRWDGKPCPLCQSPGFTVMLDKLCARKVNSIRVKCPNTTGGCGWTGELGRAKEHEASCQYRIVPCEFSAIGCKAVVTFNKMHEHLGTTSGAHLSLVMAAMHVKDKRIMELEQKVANHQLEIECLQEALGLPVDTSRAKPPPPKASATAPVNASRARPIAYDSPCPSPPDFSDIATFLSVLALATDSDDGDDGDFSPVDLIMHDFMMYAGNRWCSEPFYSHPGSHGHKMCLTVFVNGTGRGTGTHVSVFANLMRGENDHQLSWPFRGSVTVRLLHVFGEPEMSVEHVFRFTARTPVRTTKQPIGMEMNRFGHGNPEFVDHDQVFGIVEDLHFRITNISTS